MNFTANAIRPYRGFTSINFTEFGATSNYHALQTRLSRRFATSFTANVSYTWSKAMDQVDADNNAIGYYLDRHRENGPAGYDRKHVFTVDYIYELPRFAKQNEFAKAIVNGWQISGITRFWSGSPLNITSGGNPGTLGGGVRADYIGGDVYPSERSRFQYFNPFAFARPADGSLGNMRRNALRGPGINQGDISAFKNTKITESVTAQLRVETFNTFNHTQWASVSTGLGVSNPGEAVTQATRGSTGQVTNTRDPRNIQFGLKILF